MTTAPVFLAATETLVGAADDGQTVLDGPEGRHAAKVRRLGVGERLDLVDGAGTRARCSVRSVAGDVLQLDVLERVVEPPPSPRLVVAQALAKGDRGELAVEMLTEVGVDEVVPWAASRSVVQWRGDRGERSLERWRSTAREAAKQARRAWFPTVPPCESTRQLVARVGALVGAGGRAFVLHEDAGRPLAELVLLPGLVPTSRGPELVGAVLLVVGPEGGISPDELTALAAAGATPTRLGPTVLRTSTAGVVAAAVVLAATVGWRSGS